MNGTEMTTAVRDLIGEDTAAAYTDALILRQINQSYRELYAEIVEQNENYFGAISTSINFVAGTERYTLPTNSKILYVEITTATGIARDVRVDWVDLSRRWEYLESSGSLLYNTNTLAYLYGNQIGILPVPTSSVTAALRVWYVPPATALTGATAPPTEWSEDYHEVIVWGAFMRLLMRNKELLAENKPTFLRLRQLLLNATAKRETQEPKRIVDTYGA